MIKSRYKEKEMLMNKKVEIEVLKVEELGIKID
jgi:hypothetical protein